MSFRFKVLLSFIGFLTLQDVFSQVSLSDQAKYPLSIHESAEITDLNDRIIPIDSFLKDEDKFEFSPITDPVSNLGFTDHNFWVKVKLSNLSNEQKTLYLETGRPITDIVNLHLIKEGKVVETQKSGDLIAFEKRPFRHRKLIFPVKMEANSEAIFYLNYHSDGEVINLPLVLHDTNSLVENSYFDQLIFGIFYGILFLAGVTYLFFYFGIREKSFLLYVTYVVSIALLHLSLDGFAAQYMFQEPGWFGNRSLLVFAAFSAFAFGRYTQVYMRIGQISSLINNLYKATFISLLVLMVCILFLDAGRAFYYPFVNALAFILLILAIASVVRTYIAKKPVDLFFSIGIGFLTLGFIIFILNNFSLIPNSFVTENASKIGTGLEIIFLSLSMANRIRLLKSEKEKMQGIALQRSEESNEIKSYFLSNMSHELRTPLNAILGLSQSILSETSDPKIKNNLEVIQYSSHSLLTSINDILDYSKIEKGELKLASAEFDLQKMIQEIKASTSHQARDKSLTFSYEEHSPIPKKLKGDVVRIKQIFTNILGNSLKFTHQGHIKLIVSAEEMKGRKTKIHARIEDTGIGIKKEKLERVFESFIQQESNDKRKFGGFGLGLCIVKALVELHYGEIEISSEPNEGTQVAFDLILDEPETDQKTSQDLILQHAEQLLTGKHILVVEDNTVNQLVIKSILRKWKGVSFEFANHGLEALQAMDQTQFDIILMDLQMPEMDGYEATELIRSGKSGVNSADIPIIAVTADTTEKTKARVISIGMDDYISKPIDQELLYYSVVKALYLKTLTLDLNS